MTNLLNSVSDLASLVDVEFTKLLDEVANVSEDNYQMVFRVLTEAERVFGHDRLRLFPVPDSTKDTSNNPAKIKRMVSTPDGLKERTVDFYVELFDLFPNGRAINEALKGLKQAADGVESAPLEYKRLDIHQRTTEKRHFEKRRSDERGMFKRAIRLYLQQQAIGNMASKDGMEHVGWRYIENDEGVVMVSPKPIVVFNRHDVMKYDIVSVGQFLAYDVKQAVAKGGTLADLKATSARGVKKPDVLPGTAKGEVARIKDVPQLMTAISMVGHFMDYDAKAGALTDEGKKHQAAFLKVLAADETQMETFGNFMMAMDEIWTAIEPRYTKKMKAA